MCYLKSLDKLEIWSKVAPLYYNDKTVYLHFHKLPSRIIKINFVDDFINLISPEFLGELILFQPMGL